MVTAHAGMPHPARCARLDRCKYDLAHATPLHSEAPGPTCERAHCLTRLSEPSPAAQLASASRPALMPASLPRLRLSQARSVDAIEAELWTVQRQLNLLDKVQRHLLTELAAARQQPIGQASKPLSPPDVPSELFRALRLHALVRPPFLGTLPHALARFDRSPHTVARARWQSFLGGREPACWQLRDSACPVAGKDVVVVRPAGDGKTLTAATAAWHLGGLTIVVLPLLVIRCSSQRQSQRWTWSPLGLSSTAWTILWQRSYFSHLTPVIVKV